MTLLRQIQNAAIDTSVDLPTLLRKCKVLAVRLDSSEFKQWIEFELSGYSVKESLPDYRILSVNSKGHFSGAFGSGLRNADIPLSTVPKELREVLSHSYLMKPIASIEALLKDMDSSVFHEPWNPDIVARFGQGIYQNMNCLQAWKVIPAVAIVAIVDTVRTRVLNFVLEIESQNPNAGEAEPNSNPVPVEKVHQIFNTYITGNVQNLAPGSSHVTQTAKYIEKSDEEFFSKLLKAIKDTPLDPKVTQSLESIVAELKSTKGTSNFTKHYQIFMSILADHMQVLGPAMAPLLPVLSSMLS